MKVEEWECIRMWVCGKCDWASVKMCDVRVGDGVWGGTHVHVHECGGVLVCGNKGVYNSECTVVNVKVSEYVSVKYMCSMYVYVNLYEYWMWISLYMSVNVNIPVCVSDCAWVWEGRMTVFSENGWVYKNMCVWLYFSVCACKFGIECDDVSVWRKWVCECECVAKCVFLCMNVIMCECVRSRQVVLALCIWMQKRVILSVKVQVGEMVLMMWENKRGYMSIYARLCPCDKCVTVRKKQWWHQCKYTGVYEIECMNGCEYKKQLECVQGESQCIICV